jgi:hypothetical protein
MPDRRHEIPVHQQMLNEIVAENDPAVGYCRNPLSSKIMELPIRFQFANKLDDYDGTKDPNQHV